MIREEKMERSEFQPHRKKSLLISRRKRKRGERKDRRKDQGKKTRDAKCSCASGKKTRALNSIVRGKKRTKEARGSRRRKRIKTI